MADKSKKFITLVRLGFAARGLTYMLLGWLAIAATQRVEEGNEAVFAMLVDWTFGTLLLAVIAVGLLAYALFKLASAIADIQNRGSDKMGIAERVGDAASGIAHLVLAFAAYQFATGLKDAADDATQETAQSVLSMDLGGVVLGLAGLGLLAAAIIQARHAATAGFMKHVERGAPAAVRTIGRIGHAARAVVFGAVGWSLVKAAWFSSSEGVMGTGEALTSLRDNGSLYTLTALGLILFGMFSLVLARYQIIPDFDSQGLKPKFG
jgi:hypothetical protein